jgi:hypothetical protein
MDNTNTLASSLSSNLSFYTSNLYKSYYHQEADQLCIDFDFDFDKFSDYLLDNYDKFQCLFPYLPKELILKTIDKYLVNDFNLILDIVTINYTPYNIYKEFEPIFYFRRYYYVKNHDEFDEKFIDFDYSYFERIPDDSVDSAYGFVRSLGLQFNALKESTIISDLSIGSVFDILEKEDFKYLGMKTDTILKCSTYLETDDYIDISIKSLTVIEKAFDHIMSKYNNIEKSEKDGMYVPFSDSLRTIVPAISLIIRYHPDKELLKKHILNLFD